VTTYFVSNGGNNSDGLTWAKAYTSFQSALTAASSGSDIVVIQYNSVPSGDLELSADTTFTTANSVTIISASADDAGTAYTPTAMGTGAWIGNSTTNRYVRLDTTADDRVYVYGLTFRISGSTSDILRVNGAAAGADMTLDTCYLWQGNTNSVGSIQISAGAQPCFTKLRDCTFRFGNASQSVDVQGTALFQNCTVSADGTAPSVLISGSSGASSSCEWLGCDLSHVTGTLVANMLVVGTVRFAQCKFGSGVTVMAAQTSNPTRASADVWVSDCFSDDTHLVFGHYNALGSTVRETGIYYTGSEAGNQSWKIVTTANASFHMPYFAPFVDLYNTGTSAITPRFEILRDGSTTKYQNDEIWGEFWVKSTSGSTKSTRSTDRCTLALKLAGTTADQADGAGTGSWTGDSGAWSGKVDSGSAVTPAEIGHIRGRVVVGEPSITVYVDPVIRTA
jgi:hypothetical protein